MASDVKLRPVRLFNTDSWPSHRGILVGLHTGYIGPMKCNSTQRHDPTRGDHDYFQGRKTIVAVVNKSTVIATENSVTGTSGKGNRRERQCYASTTLALSTAIITGRENT